MRACYSTKMWVYDPSGTSPLQFDASWYFTKPGAQRIGIHHQYGSYNYQKGVPFSEKVGEVIGAPRPFVAGVAPAGVLGVNHCGADALWTGQLNELGSPIPNNAWGQPTCCTAPSGHACGICLGGQGQATYAVTAAGGTGSFAPMNGTWTISYTGTCNWAGSPAPLVINLFPAGFGFRVQLTDPALGSSATYSSPAGWNCWGPVQAWPFFVSTGAGTPPVVSVS